MSEGTLNIFELIDKIKKISLKKLSKEENEYMMTICIWLYNAVNLIAKMGLTNELRQMINESIDAFYKYERKESEN